MAWRSLGQRREGERGGKRGDGDGLDVLEPEGFGVGEDEADRGDREGTHGEAEGVRGFERCFGGHDRRGPIWVQLGALFLDK